MRTTTAAISVAVSTLALIAFLARRDRPASVGAVPLAPREPPGAPAPPSTEAPSPPLPSAPALSPPPPPSRPPPSIDPFAGQGPGARQKGVALGLFAEDVSFSYAPLIAEIAGLGATHVALVVPVYQEHGASVALGLHTRLSPSLAAAAEAVRAARRAGLEVTLFPIVRLAAPRPGEWRGTLRPADPDAWFASYEAVLGDLAAVGAATGATRLVVGSELSSLDGDRARWAALVEKVRAVFAGRLLYSANWDHYREAAVFDLVDEIGVVAYFELRAKDGPGEVEALARRWQALRDELETWLAGRRKPFVFTEVGYRSRAGSSAAPWDETPGGRPDPDEQRRAFAAFRQVWTAPAAPGRPRLDGIYVWNWYGFGGPQSLGYTPRGKPAVDEIRRLLDAL